MKLIGVDIGKNNHFFCIINKEDGEVLVAPEKFTNNIEGFNYFIKTILTFNNDTLLIGMEDTGHYHFNLLKYLLEHGLKVALINPVSTDMSRKMYGSISKNDKLDTINICNILSSVSINKAYRITTLDNFELYEQRQLTRHHHNLKEELNVYTNRLQKCIDMVFPEFNSLFKTKYGTVYMNILKTFASAEKIAHADIRTIRKCFISKGRPISLTPEQLKSAAQNSVGAHSIADEIQIKHLIMQIELIKSQISEIDKKIEEFSIKSNSPILSIPGISHFSGISILSELGDIGNYSSHKKIIKFAGVAPFHYESSQFNAGHCAISKKGSKYLRKTLYQIILPVINNNQVFKDYYNLKISQGKSHRCAQGHCIRKLLRVIYHILSTGQQFNTALLR